MAHPRTRVLTIGRDSSLKSKHIECHLLARLECKGVWRLFYCKLSGLSHDWVSGADLEGGCRGCAPPPPWDDLRFSNTTVILQKKWFIGVEVEQETSAPPPKKNPGSAPEYVTCVRASEQVGYVNRIMARRWFRWHDDYKLFAFCWDLTERLEDPWITLFFMLTGTPFSSNIFTNPTCPFLAASWIHKLPLWNIK